jgi:hypothetical protein
MIRDDAIIIRRAVFAVAKRAMTEMMVNAAGPMATAATSAKGAREAASCSAPTTETAESDTRI